MTLTIHTNALIALAAAASWGGGDFSGGMGVKATGGSTVSALRFVVLAHSISLAVLAILLTTLRLPLGFGAAGLWAMGGGVAGGLGLVAFYMALSRGAMGVSAAVSGLLAAAIPALVSTAIEGAPGAMKLVGFGVAAAAIWMIAAGSSPENAGQGRGTMALAVCGGVAFGFYFVALRQANSLGLLEPMALARSASLLVGAPVLLILQRSSGARSPRERGRWLLGLKWAVGVALLDTGGNLLFMASTRLGRLDVAAVLASLYPAGTILLAGWRLNERPTRRQFAGMAVALAAVVMITI
jgi:drug/metabolite transporter (DMT)-like permease